MKPNVRVVWKGAGLNKKTQAAAKQALGEVTEYILQESNKIVPHDEGTLERSGNTDVHVSTKGVDASVYYDTPYAVRLHEHPEYTFQNGRQGKWLESTIEKNQDKVKEYLLDKYSDVFK